MPPPPPPPLETLEPTFELYFSGLVQPSTGNGGWGIYFRVLPSSSSSSSASNPSADHDDHPVFCSTTFHEAFGRIGGTQVTTTIANYMALIHGFYHLLQYCSAQSVNMAPDKSSVNVYGDSVAVVEQMKGTQKIDKSERSRVYNIIATSLEKRFSKVTYASISPGTDHHQISNSWATVLSKVGSEEPIRSFWQQHRYRPNLTRAIKFRIAGAKTPTVYGSNGVSDSTFVDARFLVENFVDLTEIRLTDCLPLVEITGGLTKLNVLGAVSELKVELHRDNVKQRSLIKTITLENVIVVDDFPVPLHLSRDGTDTRSLLIQSMNTCPKLEPNLFGWRASHRFWEALEKD
jgi:ribonuclease HI